MAAINLMFDLHCKAIAAMFFIPYIFVLFEDISHPSLIAYCKIIHFQTFPFKDNNME